MSGMRKKIFFTLAVLLLLAGIILPLATGSVLNKIYRPETSGTSEESLYTPQHNLTISSVGELVNELLSGSRDLRRFTSYEELDQYLRSVESYNNMISRIAYAQGIPRILVTPMIPSETTGFNTNEKSISYSKTNIQVEGVDEPDIVKTDGRVIALASSDKVYVIGVRERSVLSVIALNESSYRTTLFLYNSTLIVISESWVRIFNKAPYIPSQATVYVFNISNAGNPALLTRISVSGSVMSSRLSEGFLYIVVRAPALSGVTPLVNERPIPLETLVAVDPLPNTYTMIIALDLERLRYETYTFLTGGGNWLYMTPETLYIARETGFSFLRAMVLTLGIFASFMPGEKASEVLKLMSRGEIDKAYELIRDYISNLDERNRKDLLGRVLHEINREPMSSETVFYVFSVKGLNVSFRGSFNIPGVVLDQFSMEEYKGYFIVATTRYNYSIIVSLETPRITIDGTIIRGVETQTPPAISVEECSGSVCTERLIPVEVNQSISEASHTLSKPVLLIYPAPSSDSDNNLFIVDLGSLQMVGSLTGLAVGERIYSARLIGSIFFLVTFRQIDPLFAIDISDPRNPRVLGFLKIPGFSEYLHPLSEGMLLGVGLENSSLKISLFNVTDPSSMNEISKIIIRSATSIALEDHHAVTVYPERMLIMIPVSSYDTFYRSLGALVISYRDHVLKVDAILSHENCLRAIYVGEEIFTISQDLVKIFDINSYRETGVIVLER
ncbi:MAG: beta-propeller domain-containing protein [Sulfolobales archaeon]